MARPPTFDRTTVLDRAMAAFWSKGFEATSIQDLVRATGLQRGSLYAAFGDKRGLFDAALDRYATEVSARTFRPLDDEDAGLATLEAVFRRLAAGDRLAPAPGCLVTNTAVDLAPHDTALKAVVEALLARLEARLRRVLQRAAAAGDLRPDVQPAAAAAQLLTLAQGLRVLHRLGTPEATRLAAVETTFRTLASTPSKG
jgi:TetR/AcrR family transcriptional repressor of nem operon